MRSAAALLLFDLPFFLLVAAAARGPLPPPATGATSSSFTCRRSCQWDPPAGEVPTTLVVPRAGGSTG
jgi:hypothetical protein